MSLYSFGSSRSSISERSIWSRASRRPRLPIPPLVFPPPPLSNIFREYDDDLDNLSDRPENVNLPPSDDESERSGPTLQHYLSFVRDLSRSVPQLRVVSTLPQFRKGFRLEIRDYSVINGELTVKESAVNRRVNWTAMKKQLARTERPEESSSRVREAGRRLADTTSGNVQRTIYVEDLSPGIISALGTALDINPVFFAEHLADSIYGSETQLPREAWVDTHNEDTTWSVSLEWFRPVMLDTDDYQLALDLQRAPERSYSQVLRGVYHLATEPSTKSNKLMTRAIWREKISVWCNTGKSVSVG